MAVNKYIIQLVVDTSNGTAKVKGVSKAFQELDTQVKRTQTSINKSKKSLDDMGGAAGIAGATAAELGRTISDLPYGIQAVTNNISQLGSMFALLVSSSNGVGNALNNVGRVLSGPAGILLLFQGAVAAVDFFSKSLNKNTREAKKNRDELQELNSTLLEQQLIFNELSEIAFEYSDDISATFSKNLKEVSNYLGELRKEGPITEEVYRFAIKTGKELIQSRIDQNNAQQKFLDITNKLNEARENEAWNTTKITKLEQDQAAARTELFDAMQDEQKALRALNYTATEEVVLEQKIKEEKKETVKARYDNVNAMIREAFSSVSSFRNAYINRRVLQQREQLDDVEFLEWKADFFDRLSKDSSFSFEEQTRFYAQYVAATEQLGNIQLRNEMVKISAMESINMSYADSLGTIFDTIAGLAGENRFLQAVALIGESATGIAKIIISTKAANMAARLKYSLIPGGQALAAAEIAANNFGAKVGIGANIAATASALSELKAPVSTPSAPSIGSDGSTGLPNETAPAFNVVGSGSSQLAQIMAAQGQAPVKAYVVSGEVSTAQSLERNRVKEASI